MRSRSLLVLILFAGVLLAWPSLASACPNCKEALAAQGPDGVRIAQGYSYSILFMMAMPFLLLGTGALMVVRAVKRGGIPPL